MEYDVIVVGGGIAGLTAAAYLSKEGYKTLLIEKEAKTGGLVNSFDYKGFSFDGGIRSIENSGIIFPMLKQLGIEIDFVKSRVSLGVADQIIVVDNNDSLLDYQQLLIAKFPENDEDIKNIMVEIRKIMKYMDILYGIDNPLFKDLKKNKKYLIQTIIPWSFKFMLTINKINSLSEPVYEYLSRFTDNKVLIDIIAQHFFKDTPTFFALSYFSLYMDYNYPLNGSGELTTKLYEFILDHQGEVMTNTKANRIDPEANILEIENGTTYSYKKLIWAADLKNLFNSVDLNLVKNSELKAKIDQRKNILKDYKGGDSILTLYLTLDLDKEYFKDKCTEHLFYTPELVGLNAVKLDELIVDRSSGSNIYTTDKDKLIEWLQRFFKYTTYEISIPVLRNEKLAPANKTGLIVSTLMEYSLVKHLSSNGWYDEFKELAQALILEALETSIFEGITAKVIDQFVATPLTIQKRTANSDGAITGWAFNSDSMPVVNRMMGVAKSVLTDIPNVLKAGQWSYSPSGLPISVMTGKLAADEALKELKK